MNDATTNPDDQISTYAGSLSPRAASDEAMRRMAPMLRELRACIHDDGEDRRAAAIAEKLTVLALVARAAER